VRPRRVIVKPAEQSHGEVATRWDEQNEAEVVEHHEV